MVRIGRLRIPRNRRGLVMNSEEPAWPDDRISDWLAACDDSMAVGGPAPSPAGVDAPEELRAQLERDVAWCQFVRQALPRKRSATDLAALAETVQAENRSPTIQSLTQLGRYRVR